MQRLWDHDSLKFVTRECCFTFTNSDMTSLAVSDTAQKKGGDSHHTICNAVGTTSYASSSDTGRISDAGRT